MYFMWSTASESKWIHSRHSRLSQPWRRAEPIRIQSVFSNWSRPRTSHELNSLNSTRLTWGTASEPGLKLFCTFTLTSLPLWKEFSLTQVYTQVQRRFSINQNSPIVVPFQLISFIFIFAAHEVWWNKNYIFQMH